jgi:hypothetical protein
LIGFEHLAIDGQKIEANASFRRSKNLKQVKKEYEKTKQGLEKLLSKEVSEAFPQEKKAKRTKHLEKQLKELEDERYPVKYDRSGREGDAPQGRDQHPQLYPSKCGR